jgi:hypothetical protein
MNPNKIAICCVADNKVKYLSQALRLVQSLRWFGEDLKDSDVFIGYFEPTPVYYLKEYERFGAKTINLKRYSSLHGPSNKMSLLRLDCLSEYEYVMLMDCDTIIAKSISAYLNFEGIQSKIADLQTLPHELLCEIFKSFGKKYPEIKYTTSIDQKSTGLYCNSGVILIAKKYFLEFVDRWFEINNYLLDNLELMGRLKFFCDQASFAVTLSEYEHCFRELPLSMNYPAHFALEKYPEYSFSIQPEIIHYHHMVEKKDGYLLDSSLPYVQTAVKDFNHHLMIDRDLNFSNALFWDFRYEFYPELGSGVGSREDFANYKAAIIRQFCYDNSVEELIDYGFGDLYIFEQIKCSKLKKYTGVDISNLAVAKGKLMYPEYNFLEFDISQTVDENNLKISYPYSICFDLLIHQKNKHAYNKVVENIVQTTKYSGLINGFDSPPSYRSEILFFHEPLQKTLSNISNIEIHKVGSYRQTSIYQWRKLC